MSDTTSISIDIEEIKSLIPHRYPFLLIDKVRDVVLRKSAVGIKNVTCNEPHFNGHFPSMPIMPGVMVVEAMAQTASVLVTKSLGVQDSRTLVYFMTIDKCKFRGKVVPGDVLELHVETIRGSSKIWKFAGKGIVDGKVVAQAEFSAMMVVPEEE